jgi:hypothetical protein
MKKENPVFVNCKKLIQKYISKSDIVWAREVKIAKKLLSLYPIEFFEQYNPGISIYSLAIFLTPGGKKDLRANFAIYTLTKPKEAVMLQEKPVIELEEVSVKTKSRTLQEFVDSM